MQREGYQFTSVFAEDKMKRLWRFTACLCMGLCFLLGWERTWVNAASVVSQNTKAVPISKVEYKALSQAANAATLGEIRCGESSTALIVTAVVVLLIVGGAVIASNQKGSTSSGSD
jgi:hypothetical protein